MGTDASHAKSVHDALRMMGRVPYVIAAVDVDAVTELSQS